MHSKKKIKKHTASSTWIRVWSRRHGSSEKPIIPDLDIIREWFQYREMRYNPWILTNMDETLMLDDRKLISHHKPIIDIDLFDVNLFKKN